MPLCYRSICLSFFFLKQCWQHYFLEYNTRFYKTGNSSRSCSGNAIDVPNDTREKSEVSSFPRSAPDISRPLIKGALDAATFQVGQQRSSHTISTQHKRFQQDEDTSEELNIRECLYPLYVPLTSLSRPPFTFELSSGGLEPEGEYLSNLVDSLNPSYVLQLESSFIRLWLSIRWFQASRRIFVEFLRLSLTISAVLQP